MKWLPIRFHRSHNGVHFRSVGRLKRASQKIFRQEKLPQCHVDVFWVTEREMANLHHRVKKRRAPTDVLSFPHADGPHLGDVYVAPSYAKKVAKKNDQRVEDIILRWAVHGIFHIIGYDHEKPQEADMMEGREREIIRYVGGNFVTP